MKKRIFAFLSMIAILAVFAIPTYATDPVAINGYSDTLVEAVDLTDVPDIKALSADISTYAAGTAWKITDAAGLQAFSTVSNTSDTYTFLGKTVYLANDIDMKGVDDFVPICYNTGFGQAYVTAFNGGIRFSGLFDGQGHTIRNLVVTNTDDDCCNLGLFGAVRSGAIINLVLDSTCSFTYTGTSKKVNVGSVAGLMFAFGSDGVKSALADEDAAEVSCAVVNVKSSANVALNPTNGYDVNDKGPFVGGLVGYLGAATNYYKVIKNCTYTGEVSGTNVRACGGIFGCWVEGRKLLIKNCAFAGKNLATSYKGWKNNIHGSGGTYTNVNNISAPRFFVKAYQKASAGDGAFSLRFSTLIDSVDNYDEIGIRLTVTDSTGAVVKSTTQIVNSVYTSIRAKVDGEDVVYTASELGGTYIACLTLTDIPDDLGVLNFRIETYAIMSDGTSLSLDQATVSFNGSTQI